MAGVVKIAPKSWRFKQREWRTSAGADCDSAVALDLVTRHDIYTGDSHGSNQGLPVLYMQRRTISMMNPTWTKRRRGHIKGQIRSLNPLI
jgi:hypothetical protein